jgi:DNA-binding transcriptional regulator YiaG
MFNIQLLDSVAVGKILFSDQPHLSDKALQERVYNLRKNKNLEMKKLGKTFYISKQKLENWVKETNL